MGKLTRFYDRISGQDGPVSGAIQILNFVFDTAPTKNDVLSKQVQLPTGMAFEIVDVSSFSGAVTGDPKLTVGSSAAGGEVVASLTMVAGAVQHTVVEGTIGAAGLIDVTITCDANDSIALPVCVTLVGHVAAPPTSVNVR